MHLPTTLLTLGNPSSRTREGTAPSSRNTSTPDDFRPDAGRRSAGRWILLLAIPVAVALLLAALAPGVLGAHVEPTLVPAEKRVKKCTHFEPDDEDWTELRVDPGRNGVFSDEKIEVTITNYTGKTFDFDANRSIVEAVYVRGGANDASFLYEYDPATDGDTNLTTPGEYNEIQYISFCYQAEQVPVQEVPTLEVLKTPDGQEVEAEQQFDWQIEIINSGTVDANNATLNDTIPAGLLVFGATPSQGSCTVVGQQVDCDLGTIPAGSSATVSITVLATGEECGRVDNVATVTAEGTEGDTTTVQDDGHVFVVCADAEVDKTARQASVPLGDDVVFDIVVTANGPNASENVTLADQLPDVSGDWTLSGDNATDCSISAADELSCDFGTIDAGDSRSITVTGGTGEASDCGTVSNTATIDSDLDLDDTNDSDTAETLVECPDVAVNKTASASPVDVTGDANFTITVEAVGGASAPNVTLTDTLPGTGWTLSGPNATDCEPFDGQNLTCDFGTLEGGDTREVSVDRPLSTDDCDGLDNTATVSADGDTNAANDQDSASVAVNCGDLTVDKTANPATVEAGENATFDIVVTNQGPGPATDVTLSDELPGSGWSLSGPDAGDCTLVGSSLSCDFGTIAENGTRSITVSRPTTAEDCVGILNTVTVDSSEELDDTDNADTAQVAVECPDVTVEKTPDGGTALAGEAFNWTIVASNQGNATALDVEVTDAIPSGLEIASVSTEQGSCSVVGQQVTCEIGDLASGASVQIDVRVQTDADDCGVVDNTAEVSASNEAEVNQANNSDDGSVTVLCPDLEVEKTPDAGSEELGDVFDFAIVVTNDGDGAALDVEVTDDVPDGLDVLQVAPPGDCSFVDQQVTCTFDRIEPGEQVEIEITVQAMRESCGFNENLAEVSAGNEPSDALADNSDVGDVTVDCPADRANVAHRPFQTPTNEGFDEPYLSDRGLFVNPVESPHANATARLYGDAGLHAPDTYDDASDPYDRTVIPSDSATFNPALILHTDQPSDLITGCEGDANLKKYLRTWYEPERDLDGSRVDAGDYQATRADVIQVESTYRLIDASSYTPTNACEGSSFPFPTEGVHLEDGDGHEQPGLDRMTNVTVGEVPDRAGTDGTVELERTADFDEVGDSVQFLDHRLTFRGVVTTLEGEERIQLDVEYLGNTFADAERTVDLGERRYFTRSNIAHETALHDAGSDTRTFYAEFVSIDGDDETATVLVGKELSQGDTFYVDGVRYDVPAVTTTDDGDGQLSSITLRTPIPKSDPEGSWTSVTDETREERIDGQFQVQDNSVVTTQWLVEVDRSDPIPVDPPFNHDEYRQVDDTDVQLWEQGEDNTEENFPYGPADDSVDDGGDGMPMFPEGERYLTMEDPPQAWKDFFDAEPTGYNDTGTDHADSLPDRLATADGINHRAWAPSGTTGPHAFDATRVNFTWTVEAVDGRLSKNVLELRDGDTFDVEDDPTIPDRYTTFLLPDRPNPVSRTSGTIQFDDPCSREDVVPGGLEPAECQQTYQLLGGDYLVTTSFRLQDQETRHAFAHDPEVHTVEGEIAAGGNTLDDVDLYFNARNLSALFDDERPVVADTTARLYGEEGDVNQAPDVYADASDAFDARAIPKDSATFSPAIVRHTDPGAGTITACGEDAHLKKHLRVFYEPGHDYHGPRIDGTEATVADVIQVESTYHLLDASSYRPTTACADSSRFPFPTEGANVDTGDGHEQPGVDTMQTVRLGNVSAGTSGQGTIELERRVNLDAPGDAVQLFDHRVELVDLVSVPDEGTHARLEIGYTGNYQAQSAQAQEHNVRERIYLTRSNDAFAAPAHDAGSSTRTWYVELVSFDAPDESATLIVGKEIAASDAFYVDGVRYEVPSLAVEDGELAHLTLRTPIPKSDPGGSWTSVTDPTREQQIDGQWQVEDPSQVTTQFLVQVDNRDPIPVDPPFNQETYQMVDDVDVQLWEPTANAEHFPWGPADESLPEGTGTPMFPAGQRYLTMENPSQAWKDFFEVEPTGYLDEGQSYADDTPQRIAEADGINHNAWEEEGPNEPPILVEENTTFYWLKEWYEGRYSTNQLEIPDGETFRGEQVQTRPDRYTEFVFPDRPNPVSLTEGTLAYGDDPACTRTDVVDRPDCERTVPLLGGDYAILTSLVEANGSAQPERASPPPLEENGDGDGSDGADAGTADTHAYDANGDCVISDTELLALVADWGDDRVSDDVLLDGVAAWGMAPDAYC